MARDFTGPRGEDSGLHLLLTLLTTTTTTVKALKEGNGRHQGGTMARDDVRAKLAAGILIALAVGSAVQGALGARQGVSFARRSERKTWGGPVGEGENEGGVAFHPKSYPLFKQCDDWWGDDTMETKTICEAGDLMTSLAMGLAGWKIPIDPFGASDPDNLNFWLRSEDAYTADDEMIGESLNALVPGMWSKTSYHKNADLSTSTIVEMLKGPYIMVGRFGNWTTKKDGHWALVTDYDGWNAISVNDPKFDKTQYGFNYDLWGWYIFNMTG